jgi:acyl-CoA thioesterase I
MYKMRDRSETIVPCRYRITLHGAMLTFLMLVSCAPSTSLPRLPPDAVIVAFGDSLTYGSGATQAFRYPTVLSELTGRTVINAGVPGEMSAEGLKRLPQVLAQYSPDLLVLIHGGNDLLRRADMEATRKHLEGMLRLAKQRGLPVVMLGVPRRGIILSSADFYEELADEYSVPIDTEALPEILSDPDLKADPVHPNAQGYRMMAQAVYRLLEDHGAL